MADEGWLGAVREDAQLSAAKGQTEMSVSKTHFIRCTQKSGAVGGSENAATRSFGACWRTA